MKRLFLRCLRYGFFGAVCLVTLGALIFAEENFRGKRAWDGYKREMLARGVELDFNAFVSPSVPDEQNFAMTPLLKPLFGKDAKAYREQLEKRLELPRTVSGGNWAIGKHFDPRQWNKTLGASGVLLALRKFDPEMDEIGAASRRPYIRFPVRNGAEVDMIPMSALISLARLFELRALAELGDGQTDKAMGDVETILQITNGPKKVPLLGLQLFGNALLSLGIQPVWEGLSAHRWSESQLVALQNDFGRFDLLASFHRSIRGDMAFNIEALAGFRKKWWNLQGWLDQNLLSSYRYFEEHVLRAVDPVGRRVFPEAVKVSTDLHPPSGRFSFGYNALVNISKPVFDQLTMRAAYFQTAVDQVAVACALECFWRVNHSYPEKLDALVPQYIERVPHDVIGGKPLRYRRTEEGGFLLWSIGWNEVDDRGTAATDKTGRPDLRNGDWVWRCP